MPAPTAIPREHTHTLYVWDAQQLLQEMQNIRRGAGAAIAANDALKSTINADVVALSQLVQSGTKIARQIKLLGITGRAYIKTTRGKTYVIFKGNPRARPNLTGTRYAAEHAKVSCFVIGSRQIVKDAAAGTKVAIIAFIAIDIVTELTSDQPSLASLGVRITSDALQAVISSAAGAAAGVVLSTVGAPVVITFIVVVAVGFAVGMLLTRLDREYQLTDRARARMMAFEKQLVRDFGEFKRQVVIAERQMENAARRIGNEISEEWYRMDRYYRSVAQMVADRAPALMPF